MNVLIIEDEEPASHRLAAMLTEIDPSIKIINTIVSVGSAVKWFKKNERPDLIMMDIQLSDGISFDIFNEVKIDSPVIFTTAFDQYAIQAFKVNGIDYLLKPVKREELAIAIEKYKKANHSDAPFNYEKLLELVKHKTETYQKRIIVRYRDVIKTIEIESIAYFFVENKITYLHTKTKVQYAIDHNLDELEKILDPKKFFRINRQFIVNIDAIEKMIAYSKSRVKLVLNPPSEQETIVSAERSPLFKTWLLGKE